MTEELEHHALSKGALHSTDFEAQPTPRFSADRGPVI